MKGAAVLLNSVVFCLTASIAICRGASVDEIALYNKPDRQKILVEGAKKEGKISWYTTLIVDQVVRPLKETECPLELKDAQGFWGVANLYFFALGYNTRMVKPAEVPKSYEDLLHPRWKGQMIWGTGRGAGAPLF